MIRELESRDAQAILALRRTALAEEPLSFKSSPADDRFQSVADVAGQFGRGPDWTMFGAFDPDLVGMVGVMRGDRDKTAHSAHIWGMYVAPTHRGRGLAAGLLDAAVAHARALEGVTRITLGVSSRAPAARRLYERAGFVVWGTEPEALRHGGEAADEIHMVMRLG